MLFIRQNSITKDILFVVSNSVSSEVLVICSKLYYLIFKCEYKITTSHTFIYIFQFENINIFEKNKLILLFKIRINKVIFLTIQISFAKKMKNSFLDYLKQSCTNCHAYIASLAIVALPIYPNIESNFLYLFSIFFYSKSFIFLFSTKFLLSSPFSLYLSFHPSCSELFFHFYKSCLIYCRKIVNFFLSLQRNTIIHTFSDRRQTNKTVYLFIFHMHNISIFVLFFLQVSRFGA